ncbi:MAG: ribosome maturation factor RimM [Bacteroidota bacterium]
MILKNEYRNAGSVHKIHGYRGELILLLLTGVPEIIEEEELIFIETDGYLVPFFIEGAEAVSGNRAIVRLADIDTPEKAKALAGLPVFLHRNLIESLEPAYDFRAFIGFEVYDGLKMCAGVVREVMDIPGNPVFVLEGKAGDMYVPVNAELIVSVDMEGRRISMRFPDGLKDLNA